MANTSSAKKATRKMIRRTEINKARHSRLKTTVRSVEEAVASGNKAAAEAALKVAEPILMQAASRKVSRLTARVRGMTAA
jgi:small subunit ribosomal protein S20